MSEKTESRRLDSSTGYHLDISVEDGKTYVWVGVTPDSLLYHTPSKVMTHGQRDPEEAIWWFGKPCENCSYVDAEMFAQYIKSVEQGYALRLKATYKKTITENVEKALGIS